MKRSLLLVLPLLCAQVSSAQSNIPASISYQGRVADAAGALLGDPAPINRTITLRIYGTPTGTGVIYAEQQVVTISKGQFSVLLGTGLPVPGEPKPAILDALNGADRFLGVTVDDGTPTADPEISPRQQLVSTAFALRTRRAESAAAADFSSTSAMAGSVQAFPGGTTNFNWVNVANLTVNGHSKITGGNVLEFGSNLPKAPSAGQIGYQSYSNGLDIVGAGTSTPERRITLWAEGGLDVRGKLSSSLNFGNRTGQHLNLWGTEYGIGIQGNTFYNRSSGHFTWYQGGIHGDGELDSGGGLNLAVLNGNGLTVNAGSIRINGGGTFQGVLDRGGHGVFTQSWGGGHSFGSQDWTTYSRTARNFAWYLGGAWDTNEMNPGGGTTLAMMDANGLHLSGEGPGSRAIELGYGVAGKEGSAGYIGYKRFSDGLDIVGAGTDGGNRKIKLWSEGGTEISGGLNASSNVEGNDLRARSWVYCNNIVFRNSNGNYRWETKGFVDYDIVFDGSTRYRIDGNGNTFKLSDRNMKKDVQPFTGMLPKLMKLKPSSYHFKSDTKDKAPSYGFIAQEVQEVFPELITKIDEKNIGLNYDGLIPVAVAAIQEQQKQLEAKDAEIAALKKELAAAKEANTQQDTRLAAIEKALKLQTPAGTTEKPAAKVATRR